MEPSTTLIQPTKNKNITKFSIIFLSFVVVILLLSNVITATLLLSKTDNNDSNTTSQLSITSTPVPNTYKQTFDFFKINDKYILNNDLYSFTIPSDYVYLPTKSSDIPVASSIINGGTVDTKNYKYKGPLNSTDSILVQGVNISYAKDLSITFANRPSGAQTGKNFLFETADVINVNTKAETDYVKNIINNPNEDIFDKAYRYFDHNGWVSSSNVKIGNINFRKIKFQYDFTEVQDLNTNPFGKYGYAYVFLFNNKASNMFFVISNLTYDEKDFENNILTGLELKKDITVQR